MRAAGGRVWGVMLSVLFPVMAQGAPKIAEVPTFKIRARVMSVQGKDPGEKRFRIRLGGTLPNARATATEKEWSEWLEFDRPAIQKTLKGYPGIYMRGFPVVTGISVEGAVDPTVVEAEIQLDENQKVIPIRGELFGPNLGVLVWRDEAGAPQAGTQAMYNQRYWKELEGVSIPAGQRPTKFPIAERFIGGDDDRIAWRDGISAMQRAGFSAVMLPPSKPIHALARELGVTHTAWAVYSPPGYAFDTANPGQKAPPPLGEWAAAQAKQYRDAGWDVRDVAIFGLSDEPGWYYPSALKRAEDPAILKRFRQYLQDQGLTPADVGAGAWELVRPIPRSGAKDLAGRRLFYWTMRFFPWDSARYFADTTRAMEAAFYPGLPLLTNWNFFAGRSYVPGAVANNPDKTSPDAAMGGHDWFEFGRLRGCTTLWTEDWFGDSAAYQWSFYCSKLRCAAEKGGVRFGGYPIPRASGDREDGLLQKVMCLVGSGGKAVKTFVFGPEYNFPGNCYSETPGLLRKLAQANAMIGAAEELLWEGKRGKSQVAILMPRSSQFWDLKDVAMPKGISDATNANLNGATVDYMAEVFDLYLALQHANIPVDFVEEDDLSAKGLAGYRVLYVTAPNVPAENQAGLGEWVKAGGTLVTVSGAGARDRYDEACGTLADVTGVREEARPPMAIANLAALKEGTASGEGRHGAFTVFGPRGKLIDPKAEVLAKFSDGAPAAVWRDVGKGRAVHFAFLPGLSYVKSSVGRKDRLPIGFSEALRKWIAAPATEAGVVVPVAVNRAMVETPLLLSDKGAAVTVLNWMGEPIEKLEMTIRLPFKARSVQAVRAGALTFEPADGGIKLALPAGAVDVIQVRP